jgi:hypothetical protein
MAKKAKSEAAKVLETAAKTLKDAKEKLAKQDTDVNKKAVEHAATVHSTAKAAVNRERFLNVGANRTGKAIVAVRNLAKVFNPRSYKFEKGETDKVLASLRAEMATLESIVAASLSAPSDAAKPTKEGVFKF